MASNKETGKPKAEDAKPWSLPKLIASEYDNTCSLELVEYIRHTDEQYREGLGDRTAVAREVATEIIKFLKSSGTCLDNKPHLKPVLLVQICIAIASVEVIGTCGFDLQSGVVKVGSVALPRELIDFTVRIDFEPVRPGFNNTSAVLRSVTP